MNGDLPIGVFDSGVGGLTVVRALRRSLPGESFIYLGDTARVPYGTKSPSTVVRYSLNNARFLLAQGIKMLVVACNTASAHAIPALQKELSIPVVGVVEPGARAALAATRNGCIGVIGTYGTVESGAYQKAISELRDKLRVAAEPCPLLVPLAEEGWLGGEVPRLVTREYLGRLHARFPEADTLVMGCTHYPLFRDLIAEVTADLFGREVALIDSGVAATAEVAHLLGRRGMEAPAGVNGTLRVMVTDKSRIDIVGTRFLGEALAEVSSVDVTA
ncbi:MAG: glutamate racemase [Deltaproteobacteria bacterium HGW-Deltaproteobacteria-17]|nr:MAG: glutamate racemase [Deltaproteobacteria bacterium HGW-Deltaproteobacteria-17]